MSDSSTPWYVTCQASPSMGFSRQEYWSGLPFPSPGDLNPGMESRSPTLRADSLSSEPRGNPVNIILQLTIDVHLKFIEGKFHVTTKGRKKGRGDLEIFTVRNGSKIMVTC